MMNQAVEITVNGKSRQLPDNTTIKELLTLLNMPNVTFAIECNHQVIPKTAYSTTTITSGDRIEIVTLVGGG